jgi:hypothetical protein
MRRKTKGKRRGASFQPGAEASTLGRLGARRRWGYCDHCNAYQPRARGHRCAKMTHNARPAAPTGWPRYDHARAHVLALSPEAASLRRLCPAARRRALCAGCAGARAGPARHDRRGRARAGTRPGTAGPGRAACGRARDAALAATPVHVLPARAQRLRPGAALGPPAGPRSGSLCVARRGRSERAIAILKVLDPLPPVLDKPDQIIFIGLPPMARLRASSIRPSARSPGDDPADQHRLCGGSR